MLGAEYERLRRTSETGRASILDEYGAENPAEFFAVATEAFFERPVELRAKHAALYDELRAYYNQDPAEWRRPSDAPPDERARPSLRMIHLSRNPGPLPQST